MIDAARLPAPPDDGAEALVRRAREAAEDGHVEVAVALLTDANRAARDPLIEREIVRLRARGTPPVQAGDDDWQLDGDDPFPDLEGIPELELEGALDPAMVAGSIRHHGALLVRDFAERRAADELRETIDSVIECRAAVDEPALGDWYDPLPDDEGRLGLVRTLMRNTGGLLAVDSPRAFFLTMEIIGRAGLVEAASSILGERPVMSIQKTTLRRIGNAPNPTFHQDGSFLGTSGALNCWLALSHCGEGTDAVGLDLVPARIPEILPTDVSESSGVSIAERTVLDASPRGTATPRFAPGDALIFDERFVHRTSAIPQPGRRHALEAWLFAPSRFPAEYSPLFV